MKTLIDYGFTITRGQRAFNIKCRHCKRNLTNGKAIQNQMGHTCKNKHRY